VGYPEGLYDEGTNKYLTRPTNYFPNYDLTDEWTLYCRGLNCDTIRVRVPGWFGISEWDWNQSVNIQFNGSSTWPAGETISYLFGLDVSGCQSVGHSDFEIYPIYHGIEPVGDITPTPEPTPTLGPGVCSAGGLHEVIETGEGILPKVWLRPGDCLVVIPELTDVQEIFDTLGIAQPEWLSDWTGVQLCFTYVGMSNMNLFGISFNPIYFMLALAAIGLLRNYLLR
jgi:hypothetical protein